MKRYTFADIYSGCGGFTAGFSASSAFRPVLAVDIWDVALDTLKRNFPEVECLSLDLSVDGTLDPLAERLQGVDVLLGGPPCQGFSTLGKRRDSDARSTLVDTFAELTLRVQPSLVVVENVKGITSKKHPNFKTYAEALITRLERDPVSPYVCHARLLNACDFGIPQSRVRWFMVGVRADLGWTAVQVDDLLTEMLVGSPVKKTVREAIEDLPRLKAGEASRVTRRGDPLYNHQAMRHSRELIERLKCVPSKGGLPDVPQELLTPHLRKMLDGGYGSGGHVKNIYGRLDWDQPSGTVVAGIDKITCGRFVHPVQHRLLTPRECARLQSFEDSFEFLGGQVAQYYQIGNAVPPGLAKVIANAVAPLLRTEIRSVCGIENELAA